MCLKEELDTLASFDAFIVLDPSLDTPKSLEKGRTTNSVNYAGQVISSVRGHYARMNGRRPGLSDGPFGGKIYRIR